MCPGSGYLQKKLKKSVLGVSGGWSFQALGNICATQMPGNCPSIDERRKGNQPNGVPKESSSRADVRAGCVLIQEKIKLRVKILFPLSVGISCSKTPLILGFSIFSKFEKTGLRVIFQSLSVYARNTEP